MKMILTAVFFGLMLNAGAQTDYAISKIPDSLLKGANAVKRISTIAFEMQDLDDIVIREKEAITILNEAADDFALLYEPYSSFSKISSIEGTLYDAYGNKIKSLKPKDVVDRSSVSDFSIDEDSRVKTHHFYYRSYPYTVEYEVVRKSKSSYMLPALMPAPTYYISVEKSSISLTLPATYNLRYKAVNCSNQPVVVQQGATKKLTCSLNGIKALAREPWSPRISAITPYLLFAPTEFAMGDYKGNMANWTEFGKFSAALNKDRDRLPETFIQKAVEVTSGLLTAHEKVEALYHYLQKNTRYISIQRGIGGLQPLPAEYVATKGYGDCKALSNYMYSLLKAVNIKSHYTLVGAGEQFFNVDEQFPTDRFNHVILCVPLQKDTMWLECTSQTEAAGYQGSFTGNRKALLITDEGGVLVDTKKYGINENTQLRSIKAVLGTDGVLKLQSRAVYSAMQQDELDGKINNLTKDKLKESLNEDLGLATYTINQFAYNQKKGRIPTVDETLDLDVEGYANITGKRIFINPNVLNRTATRLLEPERKLPLHFSMSWRDVDSVEIEVPEGYEVEAMPATVQLQNEFGSYHSSVQFAGNKIKFVRVREQYGGQHAASKWAAFMDFYNQIVKADTGQMVLRKKS